MGADAARQLDLHLGPAAELGRGGGQQIRDRHRSASGRLDRGLELVAEAAAEVEEGLDPVPLDQREVSGAEPGSAEAREALATAEQDFATAREAFDKVRGPYEAAAQEVKDLVRQFSRNQLIAVRDSLIDFLRVVAIPENRNGPVPAATPETPAKK